MPSRTGSGWAEEEFRRVTINFSFGNFEGQGEISSEASAFQQEAVELAKPFLIWKIGVREFGRKLEPLIFLPKVHKYDCHDLLR